MEEKKDKEEAKVPVDVPSFDPDDLPSDEEVTRVINDELGLSKS